MPELVSRNLVVNGKRSSMRLEPELWDAFRTVCNELDINHVELMKRICAQHTGGTVTSTTRAFLFNYFRAKVPAAQEAA